MASITPADPYLDQLDRQRQPDRRPDNSRPGRFLFDDRWKRQRRDLRPGTGGISAPAVSMVNSIIENNGRSRLRFRPGHTQGPSSYLDQESFSRTVPADPRGFGAYTRTGGSDASLGSLADNGGPTYTQALLPGSACHRRGDRRLPRSRSTRHRPPASGGLRRGRLRASNLANSLIVPPISTPVAPTATSTPTKTPTPTLTPTPALSFGQPSVSLDHFYFGKGDCIPTTLTVRVSFSDPGRLSYMLLFFQSARQGGRRIHSLERGR